MLDFKGQLSVLSKQESLDRKFKDAEVQPEEKKVMINNSDNNSNESDHEDDIEGNEEQWVTKAIKKK